MSGVQINEGTQTVVKTRTVVGEEVQSVYINIGTAADNPFNGTILEVSKLATGTVSVNTPGTITSGSMAITAGTVVNNGGTVAEITNGTIRVTAGTMVNNGGTVAEVTNILNGTIQNSGTVTGVGTVSGVATVSTVTTVSNVTNGTVRITAGTVNAATINDGTLTLLTTLSNLTNGTVRVTAGTVNAGTINTGTINEGTLSLVTTVSNLTNGTVRVTAGTMNSGTLNAGTINTGTINAATINAGTVRDDGRAARDILSFGTVFGGTGTVFAYATLVAAPGASNYVFVNDLSITNPYGTIEAGVGYGTHIDGGSVLIKGVIGTQTGLGIEKVYPKAVNGGITNQPLILYRSNVGTIYANVTYFTST